MSRVGTRLAGGLGNGERWRLAGLAGTVLALHLLGWGALLWAGASRPPLIGLGALAYTFGLRHAFDADHIAAIDNTTRKLVRSSRRPLAVGFFFSLGHSTVVLAIAVGLGLAVKVVVTGVVGTDGDLRTVGGLVGTSVSGLFLLAIGVLNLALLVDVYRGYRRMRGSGAPLVEPDVALTGPLSRLFGGVFRLVDRSWHMYPVGFLFGLGFDTASEVALLAISAGAAANGVPISAVVALPLIFAAGMALMDTADGVFMARAYAWAFSQPIRKVFYNLTVTGLSVFVALFVASVELSQIGIRLLGLRGGWFAALTSVGLGDLGYIIVAAFVLAWAVGWGAFKLGRVEERWAAAASGSE